MVSASDVRFEAALGRKYRMVVTLVAHDSGTRAFGFEAEHGDQRLEVPEQVMDALRRTAVSFAAAVVSLPGESASSPYAYCAFGGQNHFKFQTEVGEDGEFVLLVDLQRSETSDRLMIPADLFSSFVKLLFDDRLGFPSGCLERVMSYHSLIQLAFPNVSGSLNAVMGHRSGFLMFEIASPRLLAPVVVAGEGDVEEIASADGRAGAGLRRPKPKSFASRLGIRTRNPTSVNYDELLASLGVRSLGDDAADSEESAPRRKRERLPGAILDLGLVSAQILGLRDGVLRFKAGPEDLEALRDAWTANGGAGEFFLGIDIVDLWYLDRQRKVRALRFPLYYAEVMLSDLGAEIEVRFADKARLRLNFLALCDVVTRFTGARAPEAALEEILTRIQKSRFEWRGGVERIRVERHLPLSGGLLNIQRRIVLGQEERGPLGGALEGLRVEHVTIDSDRTLFFPRNLAMSEADVALSADLERIREASEASTTSFNATLLGAVFNPLLPEPRPHLRGQSGSVDVRGRADAVAPLPRSNPYELPDALRFLFDEFERKDLILVEGPPGTGKTFSMLNLLVHCVCSGKRVLVVSDKVSALDALYEKLVGFMADDVMDEREKVTRELALRAGVKRPVWSEQQLSSIQDAARTLRTELRLDLLQEILVSGRLARGSSHGSEQGAGTISQAGSQVRFAAELASIDKSIQSELARIDRLLAQQFGENVPDDKRVCGRVHHETTAEDVRDLADFCQYLVTSPDLPQQEFYGILKSFLRNRRDILAQLYPEVAPEFCPVDFRGWRNHYERMQAAQSVLETILSQRPLTLDDLMAIAGPLAGTRWPNFFAALHARAFAAAARGGEASSLRKLRDRIFFPLAEDIQNLLSVVTDDLQIFRLESLVKCRCVSQLERLHRFVCREGGVAEPCLAWSIVHQVVGGGYPAPVRIAAAGQGSEVGACLHGIARLQNERSQIVRRRFALELLESFHRHVASKFSGAQSDRFAASNDLIAEIDSRFEHVVKADNVAMALESFDSLKRVTAGCFPVWLLLKDQVSLALPMIEGLFDVVIIDESTQCRVDDAIPLIYRARKVIAVGDENQTVLQRSSVLDDFLFENFELESHLHTIGATAVKAAGSHFFALLKGLKQSRVLLDEHFRCPPEVIEYSNKYVYDGMLKIMKWRPQGELEPVIVDYSERRTRNRNKPTSGKFKGIEIGMIDRFFEWVEESIIAFEKESGRRINLETDVALCYFLLKNEEYVKRRKAEFLRVMKRGDDVLDGAGAALQGKERDLIFFLWDITRANFQAFMQGDDPVRRKGELNVLMSRPRLRAYHYLHKDFATLDHNRSSITHYLWSVYKAQESARRQPRIEDSARSRSAFVQPEGSRDDTAAWDMVGPEWVVRQSRPSPNRLPWRRTDGQLVFALLRVVCARLGLAGELARYRPQFGVIIGRPEHRVDLVLNPVPGLHGPRIALIELTGFEFLAHGGELQAYASILGRAQPAVTPLFFHVHELFAPQGFVVRRLVSLLASRESRE